MLVPQPFFAVVSARTGSAVTEVLSCPQSATEVHRSTFSNLATATGSSNFLRLPNNPSFPDQSSVATYPVLRLQLKSSHPQMCRCEKMASECASPRALQQRNRRIPAVLLTKSLLSGWSRWKVTHCSVINASIRDWVLRMVASFRFICAQTFCNKLGRCSHSSFLKAFLVTSLSCSCPGGSSYPSTRHGRSSMPGRRRPSSA